MYLKHPKYSFQLTITNDKIYWSTYNNEISIQTMWKSIIFKKKFELIEFILY